MSKRCPDCGADLIDLDPDRDMGSKPTRHLCSPCQLVFVTDPAGGLREEN